MLEQLGEGRHGLVEQLMNPSVDVLEQLVLELGKEFLKLLGADLRAHHPRGTADPRGDPLRRPAEQQQPRDHLPLRLVPRGHRPSFVGRGHRLHGVGSFLWKKAGRIDARSQCLRCETLALPAFWT